MGGTVSDASRTRSLRRDQRAKTLFLRDQEGLAGEEGTAYAGKVRTYPPMQEDVSLAIRRADAAGTGATAIPT